MSITHTIYSNISKLMPKRGFGRASAVGLDIGSYSVKLVKAQSSNKVYTISCLAFADIKGGNIKEAVKDALSKVALDERRVNLGLSGKNIIIRCVLLPEMDEATFKSSIKYEVAKHIPFPPDQMNLDYHILKHNAENNKMLVLIAGAKKDFVQERLKLVSELGLQVNILDIDSLAIINMFNIAMSSQEGFSALSGKKEKSAMAALLNIGERVSNLSLLENGVLKFSRDIIFAGGNITQKISEKAGISLDEAEKIKLSYKAEGEYQPVIEASLADLTAELRFSFDYYESQTGKAIDGLYLSGAGAYLFGLDKFINAAMNIDTIVWNPFLGFEIGAQVNKEVLSDRHGRFAVAAGLALR